MKVGLFIFFFLFFLVSCGNKGRQEHAFPIIDEERTVQLDDSIQQAEEKVEKEKVTSTSMGASSSSSSSHHSSSDDNMRGFDPASEDDFHDNGMSRYMENNDEEGWD